MRLILALAVLWAACWPSQAAERVAYGVHLGSYHTDPEACRWDSGDKCNNANPGGYVRRGAWIGGGYYNSVHRPTLYAGRVWPLVARGRWDLSLGTIVATGYPAAPLVPVVTPIAGLELPGCRCTARVLYLPRLGTVNPTHVLHLALEWRGD